MGTYVNPGNQAFKRISGPNYVDKTDLISRMNVRIGGDESLVCVSRPRRFGKSYAAKMLTAYYDCSCDSHCLFEGKKIEESEDYEAHLNKYNVICLDISGFVAEAQAGFFTEFFTCHTQKLHLSHSKTATIAKIICTCHTQKLQSSQK
ncbi:MAG: AAA family ATPase [Clostridia bacterium]|nr:AAA family ATPase [Clostridia bacterium]